MEEFITVMLSDAAIIVYEFVGVVAAVIVGNIFGKKIKVFQTFLEKTEHDSKYEELDHALENVRRR